MITVNLIIEELQKANTKVFVKTYDAKDRVVDTFYTTVDQAFAVCSDWNSFRWRDGMCQLSTVARITDEQLSSLQKD
jgi:hypothetical protein